VICLALGAGLAGCDDGQEPQPAPESEDSVAVTDDAAATSTGPVEAASQTADPGIPKMPALAREDSEAGAEAFAEYYFDLYNYLGRNPESEVLSRFATTKCGTCENYESNIDALVQKDQEFDGPTGVVLSTQALASGPDSYVVSVEAEAPAYKRLARDGSEVDEFEDGGSVNLSIDLIATQSAFLVEGVFGVRNTG